MADFDFLDGFDADGDWGFTSVKQKPATESKAESDATKEVVKTTADNVGKAVSSEIINRLESKLDKLLRATNETKETVVAKNETELEIANGIYFLASDKASYITGQTLAVDGGFETTGVGLPSLRK